MKISIVVWIVIVADFGMIDFLNWDLFILSRVLNRFN
jgi:hypothetical protein